MAPVFTWSSLVAPQLLHYCPVDTLANLLFGFPPAHIFERQALKAKQPAIHHIGAQSSRAISPPGGRESEVMLAY